MDNPNHKKILIVEDDSMISSMYKMKLESSGYSVLVAENGMDGLSIAKKEKPSIIMLDVILPQIDGFAVLEELKSDKATKDIPVVVLTNLGTEEDIDKGKKLGAVDYIVKSNLTPGEVMEKVGKIIS